MDNFSMGMDGLYKKITEDLIKYFLQPIDDFFFENNNLISSAPGFLVAPIKVDIYISRSHIAIEFSGSETVDELSDNFNFVVAGHDFTKIEAGLLEQIIGFTYDCTRDGMVLPIIDLNEDLLLPTNRGWDKLDDLNWNLAAADSLMAINCPTPQIPDGHYATIINGKFFDSNDSGLISRHIKWLEVFPINFWLEGELARVKFNLSYLKSRVEFASKYNYKLPCDYKYTKLPLINKFIEIWGTKSNNERAITKFLAQKEHEFLLTMKFGADSIRHELNCKWQSDEKDDIRPDFFVIQPNGFADIVEFKLPHNDGNIIVGKNNRESFSAWMNQYISQTRVYSQYFDDPNNRKWFENKYGFKVYKPKRWLVVGRRSDFDAFTWREIASDYKDLEVMNFDDLVDGVVVQFYK